MNPTRTEILGVPVDCVTMAESLRVVDSFVAGDDCRTILAVNPEKIMRAREDPNLLEAIRNAGLLIPDGIGVVVAVRLLAGERIERVPGSELMPAICKLAERKGYRVYLFGAKPEVNERAVEVLCARHPGLDIAGHHHGYLSEGEMPALVERINGSGAEILFVGLGSPHQEAWMSRYATRLEVKVIQGIGGTFDVIAGAVRRAPRIFRALHLEWFYRLVTQPQRALRQTALPKFAWGIIRAKASGRS